MKLCLVFSMVLGMYLNTSVQAQDATKPHSENRFSLSLGPQYEFTRTGIKNAPDGPHTLSAKNTLGGYIGLGYERKTRGGFIFSYDLQFRVQPHNVQLDYDPRNFDPRGSIALSLLEPVHTDYSTTLYLLNHRLMIGYEHPVGSSKSGLSMQEKIGVSTGTLLSGIYGLSYQERSVIYSDNTNTDSLYSARYLGVSTNADPEGDKEQPAQRYPICGYSFNLYVGLVKQLEKRWLKSVSLGLEGRWSGRSSPLGIDVFTPTGPNAPTGRTDEYGSVNRSIGLHFALNFGK